MRWRVGTSFEKPRYQDAYYLRLCLLCLYFFGRRLAIVDIGWILPATSFMADQQATISSHKGKRPCAVRRHRQRKRLFKCWDTLKKQFKCQLRKHGRVDKGSERWIKLLMLICSALEVTVDEVLIMYFHVTVSKRD